MALELLTPTITLQ